MFSFLSRMFTSELVHISRFKGSSIASVVSYRHLITAVGRCRSWSWKDMLFSTESYKVGSDAAPYHWIQHYEERVCFEKNKHVYTILTSNKKLKVLTFIGPDGTLNFFSIQIRYFASKLSSNSAVVSFRVASKNVSFIVITPAFPGSMYKDRNHYPVRWISSDAPRVTFQAFPNSKLVSFSNARSQKSWIEAKIPICHYGESYRNVISVVVYSE